VDAKDQYMIGDALLVAPIAPQVRTRKVLLPEGRWFHFESGRFAGEGPSEIEVTPPLSWIPGFVRDGSLVPLLAAERQWAPQPDDRLPLEVRHYGQRPATLDLYDDDGETFDYERGAFSRTRLEVSRAEDGTWRGSVRPQAGGTTWRYADVTWRFMTPP
jgi:alpha-D-xyloside xylohydrolase